MRVNSDNPRRRLGETFFFFLDYFDVRVEKTISIEYIIIFIIFSP